jgi:hypothetical protein
VSKMAKVTWCDLGSVGRVVQTLRDRRLAPPWVAAWGSTTDIMRNHTVAP